MFYLWQKKKKKKLRADAILTALCMWNMTRWNCLFKNDLYEKWQKRLWQWQDAKLAILLFKHFFFLFIKVVGARRVAGSWLQQFNVIIILQNEDRSEDWWHCKFTLDTVSCCGAKQCSQDWLHSIWAYILVSAEYVMCYVPMQYDVQRTHALNES